MKVKSSVFIVSILLIAQLPLRAQFNNDWIEYDQNYLKMELAETGMYRVTADEMISLGVDISGILPESFQVFHRGEEMAISVQANTLGNWDTGDYFDFYGLKNDGNLDRELYIDAGAQVNPDYNLFSDTSAYFLTWNTKGILGQRMEEYSLPNSMSLPAETSGARSVVLTNSSRYAQGKNLSFNSFLTRFDNGEGFTSVRVREGSSLNFTISNIIDGQISDGKPELEVVFLGETENDHLNEVYIGPDPSNLRFIGTDTFSGHTTSSFTVALDWSDISPSGDLFIRVDVIGVGTDIDLISVPSIEVNYPVNFDNTIGELEFQLDINPGGLAYLEVGSVDASYMLWDVTEINNVKNIGYTILGATMQTVVQNADQVRKLHLSNLLKSVKLSRVSMTLPDLSSNQYVIISHESLRQPSGSYTDPVKEYADYRASASGGTYDTMLVNIGDLYNQFSYGEITPLAIHKFVEYISQNTLPEYLFIIGKTLSVRFNYHRNPTSFTYQELIPTAGFPESDLMFSVDLNASDPIPRFPVGRITASSPDEVVNYLEKIKTMEAMEYDQLWRKEMLHLSGGITSNEQIYLYEYMERWRGFAEDAYLGGSVKTIRKNTTETVSFINISEEINQGKNLVTFFGHSNPTITDIDIGKVSDPLNGYNNPDKYPIFYVNGCEAGQFFEDRIIWGEDWVLSQRKGAIAFIAHSSYALSGLLRGYGNLFYQNLSNKQDFVNESLGNIQIKTIQEFRNLYTTDDYWVIGMIHQMVLLGDPAYIPFKALKPDYELSDPDITLKEFGGPINALTDSFALDIVLNNLGLAPRDSVEIRVERFLEDGTVIQNDSIFPPVLYSDTLQFLVKNNGLNTAGVNRFAVSVDPQFKVDELNELNNQAVLEVFVPLNGVRNVFPPEFGIVSEVQMPLYFQTTDIRKEAASVDIEIDTNAYFNSSFLQQFNFSGDIAAKVDITLLPNLAENDSTVYYWRTRLSDPEEGESDNWTTSSFTYMNGSSEGWSQSDFFQFTSNSLISLVPDTVSKRFKFRESSVNVDITTYGAVASPTNADVSVRIDDLEYMINNGRLCRAQTLNFIAFNKSTAIPYAALSFLDTRSCGRLPQVINSFGLQEFEDVAGNLIDYIDAVGTGDTVVIFNIGRIFYSRWSSNVRNKLGELGVDPDVFLTLGDNDPIIIIGAKGGLPGSATVILSDNIPPNEGQINLMRSLFGRASSGSMVSKVIGPTDQWGSFSKKVSFLESPSEDLYDFDITGISSNNARTNLFSGPLEGTTNLNGVDAAEYSKIELSAHLTDDTDLTAPQLNRWTVLYEYPPEGILLTDLNEEQIEVPEGQSVSIGFSFINISSKTFPDSLTVQYRISNRSSNESEDFLIKIKEPLAFDTTNFSVSINTIGRGGENDIFLQVNPGIYPEQYTDNNILIADRFLKVILDEANPLINVSIDGRNILDGEIVSSNPDISILMKDENEVRILSDTTLMDVYLKRECTGCEFNRISFSSAEVNFEAPDNEQQLRFDYQPVLEDGVYVLRVEGEDASGNRDLEAFEISFEVVNESTVTNFYPYPNPFSDQMRFVFTLTGNEIPDDIRIRIMTITGKVVRDIDMDELGSMHIGNNISEFRWDGTDEYGDRLANGVYLYQVRVLKDGKDLKLRDSAGDPGFKNGIGKIYLLK